MRQTTITNEWISIDVVDSNHIVLTNKRCAGQSIELSLSELVWISNALELANSPVSPGMAKFPVGG